jgi:hypothetical protein
MADKVIVVEKRRGCGCGSLLLIVALAFVAFFVYVVKDSQAPSTPSAPVDPNSPRTYPEDLGVAGTSLVEIQFKKALRGWLRDPDSYKPNGGPRVADHPKGRAYFQDFTAKNGFGGPSRQVAGLVYATNRAETAWTFYSPDEVSDLLKEVEAFKKGK